MAKPKKEITIPQAGELSLSAGASLRLRLGEAIGRSLLTAVAMASCLAVLFIFLFIIRDALPFFQARGLLEFFTGTAWYPSQTPPKFGVLPILYGSAMVTLGSVAVAVPLGVAAAVCLSDILPFSARQAVKPAIEMLAAIPSVAYGFFALVVFAPFLQERGGQFLALACWILGTPVVLLASYLASDLLSPANRRNLRWPLFGLLAAAGLAAISAAANGCVHLEIESGTNALNVSIILGIMALPTVVSVSEDALQAVPRELREGSYALGATRAETLAKVVLPAASSGIAAASILGIMRAVGETMVVWMASGNSAQVAPWYSWLKPVRTLTATIAGDMGEADQSTGSERYHVLFAMALCLLAFSFAMNLASEHFIRRSAKKREG